MRKYQSFSSEKLKVSKLWQQNAANERVIAEQLGPLKVIQFDKTFIKTITKITLRELANGTTGQEWTGNYLLKDFPDWVINFIRPVAIFEINDEGRHTLLRGNTNLSQVTVQDRNFQYWFHKLGTNQYVFQFAADLSLDNNVEIGDDTESFDYFLTLHLYIYNYNLFDNYQKRKA